MLVEEGDHFLADGRAFSFSGLPTGSEPDRLFERVSGDGLRGGCCRRILWAACLPLSVLSPTNAPSREVSIFFSMGSFLSASIARVLEERILSWMSCASRLPGLIFISLLVSPERRLRAACSLAPPSRAISFSSSPMKAPSMNSESRGLTGLRLASRRIPRRSSSPWKTSMVGWGGGP